MVKLSLTSLKLECDMLIHRYKYRYVVISWISSSNTTIMLFYLPIEHLEAVKIIFFLKYIWISITIVTSLLFIHTQKISTKAF